MKKKNLILEILKVTGVLIVAWLLWVFILATIIPEVSAEFAMSTSMILGAITAVIFLLIPEINTVNALKNQGAEAVNNITAENEKLDNLLTKANKFTDKYMMDNSNETSNISLEAEFEKSVSQSIKNSSAFERKINQFPEFLKNEAVMELLKQMRQSENAIQSYEQFHNNVAVQYNYTINSFPLKIFKGLFRLEDVSYYNRDNDLISDEELGI